MSRTYKATGINLKGMPLGEADRLLTVLTQEYGLLRVVAPGARKHRSKIGARSEPFVVNQLLIAPGKNLDKVVQAETVTSYPGLSQNLRKLTAAQYLAELILYQALSDQPQIELFHLFQEHLSRLEQSTPAETLPYLTHGIFHLLALEGLAPQVHQCAVTQTAIQPNFQTPDWQTGFSITAGGVVQLSELKRIEAEQAVQPRSRTSATTSASGRAAEPSHPYPIHRNAPRSQSLNTRLTATELLFLQQLALPQFDLSQITAIAPPPTDSPLPYRSEWLTIERLLRQYTQYHLDRPIRSAALIDPCFSVLSATPP